MSVYDTLYLRLDIMCSRKYYQKVIGEYLRKV